MKTLPYLFSRDGLIWAEVTYAEGRKLQATDPGSILSPNLSPAKRRKPIKDKPLAAPAPVALPAPVAPAGSLTKDEARALRTAAGFGFDKAVQRMAELNQIHAKARLRGIYGKAVHAHG